MGDFNGDGFADLAVGVPNKNTPITVANSGAVIVIYGSTSGLLPAGGSGIPASQFWSQNAPGVPESSETGDRFGSALAAGDFDDDGHSDLAVGVPGEDLDTTDSGAVIVIYGSPNGLTATDGNVPSAQLWTCDALGFPCGKFGAALAWGDFDGDDAGDLAIGAPNTDVVTGIFDTAEEGGAAIILLGSRNNGLTPVGNQVLDQQFAAVVGRPAETDDHFGQTLAAGDFDGDGFSDLAIGAPDEDLGNVVDGGAVNVFYGSSIGLDIDRNQFWHQDAGLVDVVERNDRFGNALTSGDFDGDGLSDLAVGVPREDVGAATNAGAVNVIYGSSSGLTSSGDQLWTQSAIFGPDINPFTESSTEAHDFFGFSLAAGDFNFDGLDDLAIGVPLEDVVNSNVVHTEDAGEVDILYGSPSGLSITGRSPQQFHQDTINVEDTAEPGDQFGRSLTAWNFGRNEVRVTGQPPFQLRFPTHTADLAIGVPFEDIVEVNGTVTDAGAVNVLYGSSETANGLTTSNDQFLHSGRADIPGVNVSGDQFGSALY